MQILTPKLALTQGKLRRNFPQQKNATKSKTYACPKRLINI